MKIVFLGNFNVSYTSETHHANTLEKLGHEVIRLQESVATAIEIIQASISSDLLIVVHTHGWETPLMSLGETLNLISTPVITYHLDLWLGLQRQNDLINDKFYSSIDYFFATDKLMCDWFNDNTDVIGKYVMAGCYDEECYLLDNAGSYDTDIIFTGSKGYHSEWSYRPKLIDWLSSTYKSRFNHYGNDGIKVVRGEELNNLYASSKIVVGDTLCINYDYPYYFSDRLFEVTGRGGFLIFPYIKGIEKAFVIEGENKEIVTYKFNDFEDLKSKIDYYLENDEERESIRERGQMRVKNDHTYTRRWDKILDILKSDNVI